MDRAILGACDLSMFASAHWSPSVVPRISALNTLALLRVPVLYIIGTGVVHHTGRATLAVTRRILLMVLICLPCAGFTSLAVLLLLFAGGFVIPSYQTSAPYAATGTKHAFAAFTATAGCIPFVIRLRARRCCATLFPFAPTPPILPRGI
ncbi:hypothetical protein MPH_13325 [Macrophomina phaseolina MS6]|uniref:Uncharacterized protein n=1 Tax=Macrophomina phaseolina (strain MS6) TaxID=1126212 RepID=K2R9V3_MACPH|nr:hypothetical protein MPH_13325 [Macrophomina phaseolina MS6]